MTYIEIADLAEAASFRRRLKVCLVQTAGKVLGEDQGSTSDAEHNKRVEMAQNVLARPADYVEKFLWPVLANQIIADQGVSATDEDFEYVVLEKWSMVAGVTSQDKQAGTTG